MTYAFNDVTICVQRCDVTPITCPSLIYLRLILPQTERNLYVLHRKYRIRYTEPKSLSIIQALAVVI